MKILLKNSRNIHRLQTDGQTDTMNLVLLFLQLLGTSAPNTDNIPQYTKFDLHLQAFLEYYYPGPENACIFLVPVDLISPILYHAHVTHRKKSSRIIKIIIIIIIIAIIL
jgi:hypothetical protein